MLQKEPCLISDCWRVKQFWREMLRNHQQSLNLKKTNLLIFVCFGTLLFHELH